MPRSRHIMTNTVVSWKPKSALMFPADIHTASNTETGKLETVVSCLASSSCLLLLSSAVFGFKLCSGLPLKQYKHLYIQNIGLLLNKD